MGTEFSIADLYGWLESRDYVKSVDLSRQTVRVLPTPRMMENGAPEPAEIPVRISAESLDAAASDLSRGGAEIWPELDSMEAAFELFEVHLLESVNGLKIPGSDGFTYEAGTFIPRA